MAPWWTWPVVKASLALVSMGCCIVAAAVSSSAIKAGAGSAGIGIFTMDGMMGFSNPVDFWGQDVGNNKELCTPFKVMWQSMQACVVVAIVGCFGSVACSLSLLAFKKRSGARSVASWIFDLLALLSSLLLTGLLVVAFYITPCPDTFSKDSLSDHAADLGCGVYLAGASVVLIFVSLFLPAKSAAVKQARLDGGYQSYADETPM